MKRVAWTTLAAGVLALWGCGGERCRPVYTSQVNRPVANLALGAHPEHNWLAEGFTYRSSWPSVEAGYRFNDATHYTQFTYDDQSYYDDFGGGSYTRESIAVRSGVIVR